MCKPEFSDSSIDEGIALLRAIRQKNPDVKFIIPEKEGCALGYDPTDCRSLRKSTISLMC